MSKFAWQHKVPIHRSAFTYCEDELPTGLDLGKRKYGGPFTTEEVEDVKVFYGILKVLFSLGPTFFLYIASDPALYWYAEHTYYVPRNIVNVDIKNTIHYFNNSYFKPSNIALSLLLQSDVFNLLLIVMLLFIYLCTLRTCFYQYVPSMMRRIGIGIIFLVASPITTFILDTVAHYHKRSSYDCMFDLYREAYTFEDISLLMIP